MYYVYRLIDPRDGLPFYIGKGKSVRALEHECEASAGSISHKCQRIRDIWATGQPLQYEIVECESEAHAFEVERIEIKHTSNLTNIAFNPTRTINPRIVTISELFFDGLKLKGERRRMVWEKLIQLFPADVCARHGWLQVWNISAAWLIKDIGRKLQAFESKSLSRVENGAH